MKITEIEQLIPGTLVMVAFKDETKAAALKKINAAKGTVAVEIRGKIHWVGIERVEFYG